MAREPVRAVVFDVGETLVSENRAWLEWADWLGVPPLTFLGVLGGAIARGEDHRVPFRLLRPDADLRAERRRRVEAGLPELFIPSDLYPDAVPALRSLREAGFRVGVAGNQPAAAERLFDDLGVALDLVASSDSLGVEKPDPAFFAAVARDSTCRRRRSHTSATASTTTSGPPRRPACARCSCAVARGRGSRPAATRSPRLPRASTT